MPPGPMLISWALRAGGKATIKAALLKIKGKIRFIVLRINDDFKGGFIRSAAFESGGTAESTETEAEPDPPR